MILDSLITTSEFTPISLQFPNSWVGHLPFAAWIIQEVSPKTFVELGTHTGNSYFSFCQSVVERGVLTKCFAVDTWQGDEHAGQYGDEIFDQVNAHHQTHYAGFSRLLRMTFDDAVNYFSDESIDILHIDGLHTYEAVRHDFETWLPKLAAGAVVMFHDTNVRERAFGVWKLWEELQERYPNNLEFVHSHGLGVLQLNNAPDDKKLDWLQANSREKQRLKSYFAALGARQLERFELNELKQHTANLNQAVLRRDADIVTLNQAVAEREDAIITLNQVVAEREDAITTLNHVVAEREEAIITLNQVVAEREDAITTLNHVVAEREEAIITLNHVVAEREETIITLNQVVTEREEAMLTLKQILDEQAVALNQAIAERDWTIADSNARLHQAMLEHESRLSAIRRSSSWRLTAPVRFLGHLLHGNFTIAYQVVCQVKPLLTIQNYALKQWLAIQNYALEQCTRATTMPEISSDTAINAIVAQRCIVTQHALSSDPLSCLAVQHLPNVDISVVTYNSSRWLDAFVDSLIKLDYPKNLLTIRFVDNSSTDATLNDLHKIAPILRSTGCKVEIQKRPNHGYGAGHNAAILLGDAPFCLVTNIDLTFESDALSRIIAVANADDEKIAAWEMRQKPYEHPKYYDPVTGLTNWNSHACVLLRRSALQQVGYYDDTLFMYGEDVELSYRFRQAGFLLRYCTQSVVWHYSYEDITQIKPLQYTGSTFANLYLRLKYGTPAEAKAVPWLGLSLLMVSAYPGSQSAMARKLLHLLLVTPKALLARQANRAYFPFRVWDYELTRDGAFIEQQPLPSSPPRVSIITRTYCGRELYLRQALLSVIHQTYPNIEYIVVEDGGNTLQTVVDNINQVTQRDIRFIALPKHGRSATGNAGLAAATGRWCLFLDDDDLLFADHIETLVNALLEQPDVVAAYSPAWEIVTDSSKLKQGDYTEISHQTPEALRQDFDDEVLKHHNYMAIQSVLFERQLFEQRGGFEEDMDALEDWLLWVKYAVGNRFKYVPKITSMYRTPANPLVSAKRKDALDTAYALAQEKLAVYVETFKRES